MATSPRVNRLYRLFGTSIGRKLVMAATGIALLGFLVAHMLGNLTLYQGPDAINAYAAYLQSHVLIWAARLGLLVIFVVHVVTGIALARENRAARPVAYGRKEPVASTFASRYIVVTGLFVLAFVVFHLAHFTFGWLQPEHYGAIDDRGRHDVYRMVVGAFRSPLFAGVYIAAMGLLGFHLHHAVQSAIQTLGVNHQSYNALLAIVSRGVVALIVLGNWSFPILVLAGVVGASVPAGGN